MAGDAPTSPIATLTSSAPDADEHRHLSFVSLPGWIEDDHRAALRAFRKSAERLFAEATPLPDRLPGLEAAAAAALRLPADPSPAEARSFFESYFVPAPAAAKGYLTGYYEPVIEARREPTDAFSVPIYRPPAEAAQTEVTDRVPACPDRAAIEAGALAGRGLELAYVRDPVDLFFIHVQGSARLSLGGGQHMRIGFAGKSGHAYTSIGRLAVERGYLAKDAAGKAGLELWLKMHREAGRRLMAENRSFIFFNEIVDLAPEDGPLGAAGVPLSAGRSLAVDPGFAPFHLPVFVSAPPLAGFGADAFRRLMIAQDVGSAIKGRGRGDIFAGSGAEAGKAAGEIRHHGVLRLLLPKASA
ncbi:membrane-bound lytic murein transglycosylase A [Rhodopseudomonas julia]|uniref:peptidoglycan lytic exotransglycosylase n=1 Tax=Rhodopseudomonas julia TaxID=200617 RepID=A0ABU0C687_9BRAD|nr:MltA domain-containing protein [Rhodopseudomonas julia]MDQ0325416.1 membrane-bound lytic murein transglycosylase A [Rhodopseudomonas julia]